MYINIYSFTSFEARLTFHRGYTNVSTRRTDRKSPATLIFFFWNNYLLYYWLSCQGFVLRHFVSVVKQKQTINRSLCQLCKLCRGISIVANRVWNRSGVNLRRISYTRLQRSQIIIEHCSSEVGHGQTTTTTTTTVFMFFAGPYAGVSIAIVTVLYFCRRFFLFVVHTRPTVIRRPVHRAQKAVSRASRGVGRGSVVVFEARPKCPKFFIIVFYY